MFALKSVSFDEYHLIIIIVLLDFMRVSISCERIIIIYDK